MLNYEHDKLCFAGHDILALADGRDTPFFLFSEEAISTNLRNFQQSFSSSYSNIRVDYSVKTNNELVVLKILKELGSCAEVGCGHELYLVGKAGYSPSQVVFDGPCKTEEDLKYALREEIHAFNSDSMEEVQRINEIAGRLGKRANVCLRINLGMKRVLRGLAETYVSKFGIPYKEVLDVYLKAMEFKNISVIGLHTHIGSQITSVKPYLNAVFKVVKLIGELESTGVRINEVNMGGGLPSQSLVKMTIPMLLLKQLGLSFKSKVPDISCYGTSISRKFANEILNLKSRPVLCFQPGRSIVSDAGILVSRIQVVKDKWIFVDASKNFLPESLFFAERDFIIANKMGLKPKKKYNIAGCSVNSADILGLGKKLPPVEIGDIVVFLDAGAYSISRANRFATLCPPAYLIKADGTLILIRRRETYEDISSPMC